MKKLDTLYPYPIIQFKEKIAVLFRSINMNTMSKHLINNRELTTVNPVDQELMIPPQKNFLFDLSYLSIIDVEGIKATEFLQGQFTSDINLISDIKIGQAAQCNIKGRILALMDIINWNGFKLILPRDLQESTINSLNKYALLSRVTLKANDKYNIFGFYLQNKGDILPASEFFPTTLYAQTYSADFCMYHLGNGFYIILSQGDYGTKLKETFIKNDQFLGSLTWHSLRLAQYQVDIYPESRSIFLPHRLNLHQTPYISFNKGCYKGQEIIARMHYKATLKHQMKIFHIKTGHKIHSGQKILNKVEGTEIGEIIDFSILNEEHYLVAASILKDAGTDIFLEGSSQPVKLMDFPTELVNPLKQ